jgi:hypothetical protein
MPKRTKRVSALLGSTSVLKGRPSLREAWREGEEKPEPIGLTGEADDALVEGPSGVEPRLRNFIALPLEGVRKALEVKLLLLWEMEKPWEAEKFWAAEKPSAAEKPLPGVKTGPKGFMPTFCYWKNRVRNGSRNKEGMRWKGYKMKKGKDRTGWDEMRWGRVEWGEERRCW